MSRPGTSHTKVFAQFTVYAIHGVIVSLYQDADVRHQMLRGNFQHTKKTLPMLLLKG